MTCDIRHNIISYAFTRVHLSFRFLKWEFNFKNPVVVQSRTVKLFALIRRCDENTTATAIMRNGNESAVANRTGLFTINIVFGMSMSPKTEDKTFLECFQTMSQTDPFEYCFWGEVHDQILGQIEINAKLRMVPLSQAKNGVIVRDITDIFETSVYNVIDAALRKY